MKLGKLKISSLILCVPSLEINFDSSSDTELAFNVMALKGDPNVSDYMSRIPDAINRAFSFIEKHGGTRKKIKVVSSSDFQRVAEKYYLPLFGDVLRVYRVSCGGTPCKFEADENAVFINSNRKGSFKIHYKARLPRICESTSDTAEIDLDSEIADIIPYYVKSELLSSESPDEAKEAFNKFLEMLSLFSDKENDDSIKFETVFSIE
ncbi:MAG: hypothetical protein E7602_05770 [Ruminococcaceae bacterium]|nr:hypothetical protein [Oscillospiraceae bacterium]